LSFYNAYIGDFRVFHLINNEGISHELHKAERHYSKIFRKLELEEKVINILRRVDDHIYEDCQDNSLYLV